MGVLNFGGDRRREGAVLGMNVGRPIVTNGDFVASLWEPQNVEATLRHTIKVEAFEQSLACRGMLVDQDDSRAKCRLRTV